MVLFYGAPPRRNSLCADRSRTKLKKKLLSTCAVHRRERRKPALRFWNCTMLCKLLHRVSGDAQRRRGIASAHKRDSVWHIAGISGNHIPYFTVDAPRAGSLCSWRVAGISGNRQAPRCWTARCGCRTASSCTQTWSRTRLCSAPASCPVPCGRTAVPSRSRSHRASGRTSNASDHRPYRS